MRTPKHDSTGSETPWRWLRSGMVVILVLALASFVAACGSDDGDDDGDGGSDGGKLEFPDTFPKFGADYLTALPRENWITNGGTLANDRYSPLDEINTENVADLKGVWKANLQSGTDAKYSHEAQPLVYNGTMYVPTGEDDVFAIDVETGETKWKYEGELDPDISTVCCGWLSRGVAIGAGKVYIGKLDGSMVALDQETGKEAWKTVVSDWKTENGGITAAPLYYDGMIYTGITGGEFGVRGRMTALDAETGKEEWRFYTTATEDGDDQGPDDKASETWEGDSALHGGSPVWQTPSVDPELGMIYFTTGNANPDVDGSKRGGDNLYTSSFVALDVKTGDYKWHYQTVRHDIWDYDMPSPTLLFEANKDGKKVPAIAQAAKTGWVYALNRETGEPIWPIKDMPVPQDAQQKTAKTQPIPQYEPFADHEISDEEYNAVVATVKANPEGAGLTVRRPASNKPEDVVFNPPSLDGKEVAVVANGATGGTNWPPSSFNHKSRLMYVCGIDGVSGVYPSGVEDFEPGQVRLGSIIAALPFGTTPGSVTAIDVDTGEIKWRNELKSSCYSGSVTTAGGLVFVGHNDGTLHAYDAENGKDLWSFQTGAGANSTATVFEHEGKQHIAFLAGGNSLAASPHGDNLWVFSLDGELEQLDGIEKGSETGGVDHFNPEHDTDGGADADGEDKTGDTKDGDSADLGDKRAADIGMGKTVFSNNCSVCHGAQGQGGNGGPPITSSTDLDSVIEQVENGGSGMPAFGDQLSDEEIQNVSAFVSQSIAGGGK